MNESCSFFKLSGTGCLLLSSGYYWRLFVLSGTVVGENGVLWYWP